MEINKSHPIQRTAIISGIFFLLSLMVLVVTLTRGVHISQFSFENIQFNECTISWKNGFHIEIDTLVSVDEKTFVRPKSIQGGERFMKGLRLLKYFDKIVASLTVSTIETDLINGEFHYTLMAILSSPVKTKTLSFYVMIRVLVFFLLQAGR